MKSVNKVHQSTSFGICEFESNRLKWLTFGSMSLCNGICVQNVAKIKWELHHHMRLITGWLSWSLSRAALAIVGWMWAFCLSNMVYHWKCFCVSRPIILSCFVVVKVSQSHWDAICLRNAIFKPSVMWASSWYCLYAWEHVHWIESHRGSSVRANPLKDWKQSVGLSNAQMHVSLAN